MTTMYDLPIDIRVALERIAISDGNAATAIIGNRELAAAFARLRPTDQSADQIIALGAATGEVQSAIVQCRPEKVTVLANGRLARVLRPFRINAFRLGADLTRDEWARAGYGVAQTRAYFGVAPVVWLLAERMTRRLGWPDLADRCRIAAQETMVAARWSGRFGAVVVAEYRRRR